MSDSMTFLVLLGAIWVAIGLGLSLVMSRRGHSGFSWLILGTLLGPLAVALALDSRRHDEVLKPVAVRSLAARAPSGPVDVLAGYDGSPESVAAIGAAIALIGNRLGRLTVATVVPFDNIAEPERLATADLRRFDESAGSIADLVTDLKVLHGRPADALREWATEDGFELIAVGSRGAGMSKRLLGSAAYELVRGGKVPVLVVGDR